MESAIPLSAASANPQFVLCHVRSALYSRLFVEPQNKSEWKMTAEMPDPSAVGYSPEKLSLTTCYQGWVYAFFC